MHIVTIDLEYVLSVVIIIVNNTAVAMHYPEIICQSIYLNAPLDHIEALFSYIVPSYNNISSASFLTLFSS